MKIFYQRENGEMRNIEGYEFFDPDEPDTVYLPRVSSISALEEKGLFYFEELCDNWYNGYMDAEAFQKYINQCQKLLDANK